MLYGRGAEGARLSALLDAARSSRSGALVLRGEAVLAYILLGLFAGRLSVAAEAAEGLTLAREVGLPNAESKHLAMLAWSPPSAAMRRTRAPRRRLRSRSRAPAAARSRAPPRSGDWACSSSAAARGEEAAAHLRRVSEPGVGHPYFAPLSAPDLVEACVAAGRMGAAREASSVFEAFTQAGAPPRALALSTRCRALLADDPEPDLVEALRLHGGSDRPLDRARTQLLLGEHRRRCGRAQWREPLRASLQTFEQLGVAGWARRARDELVAGGEKTGEQQRSRLARLAPEELQMARLVADGHSNREVAARLFRSPRTIDAQLRRVFAKLGVASRIELAELGLGTEPPGPVLRSRLARAGLAELFRELRAIRGAQLQATLARTVGDPRLVVAYRREDGSGYTDASGRPVALPGTGDDRAVAYVEVAGREAAALVYDAALDDDLELVDALRAATGIVIENERLRAESETRLAELQASRQRIVAAGDAERRRLERNLQGTVVTAELPCAVARAP